MSVKTVSVNSDEGWTLLTGDYSQKSIDHLYSTISWLYRCVTIRGNSVASMPFEVRKGEQVIYEYDGITPQTSIPTEIEWIRQLPQLLGLVEIANCLGGRAYIERQKNLLRRRDLSLKWLLPWSIVPIYNGVPNEFGTERDAEQPIGSLLGFWRKMTEYQFQPTRFEVEDVGYFWLPDYATEIGPAKNYPGKAVLQNAGVIGALDIFLHGYFDRGLIKATLLKYKEPLQTSEASRVKEWWRRVFAGINNAHAAEVVRGDFETITIGDGIKELRDNTLTKDEKDSIAVGMGIPPSKLLPVGVNRATKDGDDRSYIEDTIIPEVVWIYRVVNNQLLNPLGYSIVALPQQLRVMQADEVERSQAAINYFNVGYAKKEIENILGIYVPDEIKEEVIQDQIDILGSDQPGEEKTLLNGIQIESALSIIGVFGEGVISRENAINMYDAFLGINPEIAKRLIPEKLDKPMPPTNANDMAMRQAIEDSKSLGILGLLDKYADKQRFETWLKNRNYREIDVDEFKTEYLTKGEKLQIAFKLTPRYKAANQEKLMDEYGEQLAAVVRDNINSDKSQFVTAMKAAVNDGLLVVFRNAANVPDNEDLNESEQGEFDDMLQIQLDSIDGFVADIFDTKGVLLDTWRDDLQEQGKNLGQRLVMWAAAARLFFNRGLIIGRRKAEMTWRLGATEEHCSDCLRFNGRKASKDDWLKLAAVGFYPQSRNLQCKGYNCDCFMEFE